MSVVKREEQASILRGHTSHTRLCRADIPYVIYVQDTSMAKYRFQHWTGARLAILKWSLLLQLFQSFQLSGTGEQFSASPFYFVRLSLD